MAGRSEDSNVRCGKGSPEGEARGEGAIYRASLAMGVTVAYPDHGGWSSFAGSRSQIRQARDARRDRIF